MKYTIYIILSIVIAACTPAPSIVGHWKCDGSGSFTVPPKEDNDTKPIKEFYDGFELPPIEFEFLKDGTMIWYNSKTTHREGGKKISSFSDKHHSYTSNYQGDKNKVLILTNNGEDENIMTIKSVTKDKLRIRLESVEDEMYLDLEMRKL